LWCCLYWVAADGATVVGAGSACSGRSRFFVKVAVIRRTFEAADCVAPHFAAQRRQFPADPSCRSTTPSHVRAWTFALTYEGLRRTPGYLSHGDEFVQGRERGLPLRARSWSCTSSTARGSSWSIRQDCSFPGEEQEGCNLSRLRPWKRIRRTIDSTVSTCLHGGERYQGNHHVEDARNTSYYLSWFFSRSRLPDRSRTHRRVSGFT